MELDLWLEDRLVARTTPPSRDGKVRIVYTDDALNAYPPETPLLSCSLPTPGPSQPAQARAFLEGLLPEGSALEAAASQVRGVRLVDGVPGSAADTVALLAEYGRECAGAVVAQPAGYPAPDTGSYHRLNEHSLIDVIANLPQRPLGSELARDIRMSLAGAQPKLLLARINGRWHEPIGGAPSTHILKPTTTWPHSAENEALIMTLARHGGLTDYGVWYETIDGTTILVAERYDRRISKGKVLRRHQEDLCQAAGLLPSQKYQIGAPSTRMSYVLKEFSSSPREAIVSLFTQVAFRVIVGDEDGHGKNYSLLLDNGVVKLAPIYDSLCTLLYPALSGRMATSIGGKQTLDSVDRDALVAEAAAMTLTHNEAADVLDGLCDRLEEGIGLLDDGVMSGWPAERLITIVRHRIVRLRSGKPLGTSRQRSPRSRTLDSATALRHRG